jgi:hypothetical protein
MFQTAATADIFYVNFAYGLLSDGRCQVLRAHISSLYGGALPTSLVAILALVFYLHPLFNIFILHAKFRSTIVSVDTFLQFQYGKIETSFASQKQIEK